MTTTVSEKLPVLGSLYSKGRKKKFISTGKPMIQIRLKQKDKQLRDYESRIAKLESLINVHKHREKEHECRIVNFKNRIRSYENRIRGYENRILILDTHKKEYESKIESAKIEYQYQNKSKKKIRDSRIHDLKMEYDCIIKSLKEKNKSTEDMHIHKYNDMKELYECRQIELKKYHKDMIDFATSEFEKKYNIFTWSKPQGDTIKFYRDLVMKFNNDNENRMNEIMDKILSKRFIGDGNNNDKKDTI